MSKRLQIIVVRPNFKVHQIAFLLREWSNDERFVLFARLHMILEGLELQMLMEGGVTATARAARARATYVLSIQEDWKLALDSSHPSEEALDKIEREAFCDYFFNIRRLAEAANAISSPDSPAVPLALLSWDNSKVNQLSVKEKHDARKKVFDNITKALEDHATEVKEASVFSFFGRPYKDLSDFGWRAKSIIYAPIALSLLAIETFLKCLYHGLKAVYDLVACAGTAQAKADISQAADELKETMVIFSLAIASPLLNAADVVVSAGISMLNYCCAP
ncbi:MAG: hypothetical protein QNK11_04725 [Legionella sp.]|nr:hypothetical protein [Legionella sp.]